MDLPACETKPSIFDLLYCLVEEENINYSDARSNGVASYIDHRAAFHSSSDILYTIYIKSQPESVNITHYYLTDSIETMTQSVEYELSCHGKGAYHNDFYNKSHIVHGTAVCPINWKMVGWKKDGDNNIYPWGNLVDISLPYVISDIYQIITPDNSVYFGNSSWKNIKIYYGVNNKWVPTLIRQGNNNKWNGGKVTTFTLGDITYQVDKGMTWAEWCNSGYNSSGFKIDENSIKVNGAKVIIAASGEDVLPSYTIVTDQGYYAFYEENN